MVHSMDETAERPAGTETLAGLIADRAARAGEDPALGPLSWRALAEAIAQHDPQPPVMAIEPDEMAATVPAVLAGLAGAAVLVGKPQPTRRAHPGEIILPVRRDGREEELVRFSEASLVRMGQALAERYGFTAGDRLWTDGSLSDIGTWLVLAAAFSAGCAVVFSPESATIAWQLRGGAAVSGPALRLVHLRAAREDLAALQKARPGLTVVNGLALPEAGGLPLCSDPRDPAASVAATVGRPLPGMEVMIVDPRTGMDMLLYQTGEIWLRGPGIMAGYANGIAPFEPRRYLRTGLLGYLDSEGRLVLPRTEEEALHITD